MRVLALSMFFAASLSFGQFMGGAPPKAAGAAPRSGSSAAVKLTQTGAKEQEVNLYIERNVAPGPKIRLSISTKNVPNVNVEIFRLPAADALKSMYPGYKMPAGLPRVKTMPVNVAGGQPAAKGREDAYYQRQVNLPVLPPGFYALRAGTGKGERIAFANITNLAIVSKVAGLNTLTWVTHHKTGKPIQGVGVEFMSRQGVSLGKGSTNADGVAMFKAKKADEAGVVVKRGNEFAILTLGLNEEPTRMTYFESDRSLYQPGQTILYKMVVRDQIGPAKYRVVKGEKVKVEFTSPDDQLLERVEMTTDERGVISGEFKIPAEGSLGDYSVSVTGKDLQDYHSVSVQEYRKPEYKVVITPDQKRYLTGQKITFKLNAETYFGAKVSGAQVNYSARAAGNMWREEQFDDGNRYAPDVYGGNQMLGNGVVTTDKNGDATIEIQTASDLGDATVVLHTTVVDGSRRQVEGTASVPVYGANIRVMIRPLVGFVPLGKMYPVEIKIVDLDGKPKGGKVTLSVRENVYNEKQRSWNWKIHDKTTVDVPASGTLKTELPTRVRWSQNVLAEAPDGTGRTARTEVYLSIADPFAKPEAKNAPDLKVFLESRRMNVGGVAKGFVSFNRPQPVLVVFEGADIFGYKLLTKPAAVQTAIAPEMVPQLNFTASQLLPGIGFHMANSEMRLTDPANQLQVTVTPEKGEYAPGDEAKVSIRVLNGKGQPVTADLSMAVIDEALLALSGDSNGSIYEHFWSNQFQNVSTNTSMPQEMSGGAFQDNRSKSQPMPAAEGMAGMVAKPENAPLRLQFEDTAYWKSSVVTDGAGNASVAFRLPGNLTTWRATARGLTETTAAGDGKGAFKATRPFTVRAALPRQWVTGDKLNIIVTANNRTDVPAKLGVKYTVQPFGGTAESRSAMLDVNGKADAKTTFETVATVTGPMRFTVELFDEAGTRVDGFQVDGQVRGKGAPWTDSLGGLSLEGQLPLPADRDLNDGRLTLTLMAGPKAVVKRLEDSIRNEGYWSPDGAAARFALALRKESKDWRYQPILDSLAMLLRTGAPEGWSYWQGAPSDPYLTARVAEAAIGAEEMEANGKEFRTKAFSAAMAQFSRTGLPDAKVMTALALTKLDIKEASKLDAALDRFDLMSPTAKLAMAEGRLLAGNRQGALDIVTPFTELVSVGASESFLPVGRNPAWTGSTMEANLRLLRMLTRLDIRSDLRDGIANWVQNHISDWSPVMERALAVQVLTEYDAKVGSSAKLEVRGATVNGVKVELRNDPDGQWATGTIPLPKDPNAVLKIDADRPVRWQMTANSVRNFQSEGGNGVRTLFRWEVRNEAGAWEELERPVKAGEAVRATAVVWGDAVSDLVSVRMPIPAGFEVVEFEPSDGKQEVRAGAITYFTVLADSRPKSFRFFLRAETEGTLNVVPATVEVVRRPDRRGWSGPMTVTVQGG